MKFKIYYEDRTTYIPEAMPRPPGGAASPSGNFSPSPTLMRKRGVIVIVQQEPSGNWVACSGYDYYIWKDNYWRGCDFYGLIEFLRDEGLVDFGVGWKKINYKGEWRKVDIIDFFAFVEECCPVLFGRWTFVNDFAQILQLAEDEREFGVANGHLRNDRTNRRSCGEQ